MTLEESVRGEVAVLSMSGEFDALDVDRFSAAVSAVVARGVVRVVLSLERLAFVNSTALGALLREAERLRQAGGSLACAGLGGLADRNFRLLGIERKIRCFGTAEEAEAWLRGLGKRPVPVAAGHAAGLRFEDEGHGGTEHLLEIADLREDGLDLRAGAVAGLSPGRAVVLRFGLELYHPTHEFRVRGRVEGPAEGPPGGGFVRIAFDRMTRAERTAIARFVRDLRYIRAETGEEE